MKVRDIKKLNERFKTLIKEVAKGRKSAFKSLYEEYGRFIYSIAASVSKSSYLADEIVDDVFLKVYQLAKTFEDIDSPIAWLCTVTSNCAKDKLKEQKPYSEIYDVEHNDKDIEKFIDDDAFYSLISGLDEDERQVVILHIMEDMTFDMVGKYCNKSPSTISSIYYRAIKILKNRKK